MARHRICSAAQAPAPGKGVHFDLPDGVGVAVFNLNGVLHAVKDSCPHMESPIHDGIVYREVVTCLWHGWQFDLRTGVSLMNEHIRIAKYPVAVEDGAVWVDAP